MTWEDGKWDKATTGGSMGTGGADIDPGDAAEMRHSEARRGADERAAAIPPLKAPGLTPYDITRDFQAEHGGSWADVSRHLWGD